MSIRNRVSFCFTLLSLCLIYPGVCLPMLRLSLRGDVNASLGNFGMNLIEKENSILQTVSELWTNDQVFVAIAIFSFSILIPVFKALCLLLVSTSQPSQNQRIRLVGFVRAIAKWSMADVMVVGIFLAYLSTRGNPSEASHRADIMGFAVDFKVSLAMSSELGTGFYYFFAYCMCSLLGLHLFRTVDHESSAKIVS